MLRSAFIALFIINYIQLTTPKVSSPSAITRCTVDCHYKLFNESSTTMDYKKEYEQCEVNCTRSYDPDQDYYLTDTFTQRVVKIILYCVLVLLLIGVYFLCKNYD
ncbi:hypothetical protein ACFFRR_000615 [Megaselia abdita]